MFIYLENFEVDMILSALKCGDCKNTDTYKKLKKLTEPIKNTGWMGELERASREVSTWPEWLRGASNYIDGADNL